MTTIRQQLQGIIVSKPSPTTAVVECSRFIEHPKYHKFFKRSKNYHAEDTGGAHKEGDRVAIESTRPRSKTKQWQIVRGTPSL